jgi:hypothetical protein
VTLALRHHLVARGKVTSDDELCTDGVPVKIQRRSHGHWRTVGHEQTNANGRFREDVRDRPGRYRALAPKVKTDADLCRRAISHVERHRH